MSNILVAYFSATGRTRKVAEELASAAGADLYEIRPKDAYTKGDLNWRDVISRSSLEMRDMSSRPALADHPADMTGHDVIFLGFPIWWYVAPTIINTFLERYDFRDKRIILFATSGGSGFGETLAGLKRSVDTSARMEEGKLIRYGRTADDLKPWVDSLDL